MMCTAFLRGGSAWFLLKLGLEIAFDQQTSDQSFDGVPFFGKKYRIAQIWSKPCF